MGASGPEAATLEGPSRDECAQADKAGAGVALATTRASGTEPSTPTGAILATAGPVSAAAGAHGGAHPARASSGSSGMERRSRSVDLVHDHGTPALVHVARDLLQAVAAGEARSLDLARDLAGAVLEESVVQRALALEELLRSGSPFALVRAVELAEVLLTTSVAARAEDGTTSGGGQ